MQALSSIDIEQVSGGINNVNACIVGSSIIGGAVGGVIGAYTTFGFGAGAGAGWGFSLGGAAGTLFCDQFFE